MSDTTFQKLYKGVLLRAPGIPLPLVKDCVNKAYSKALARNRWSGALSQGNFSVAASYTTGTISVTQGSTSVTGSGTAWTSAMEGRQLIVSGTTTYLDIETVASATSLTLRDSYPAATDSGVSYEITQALLECPSDMLELVAAIDLDNNWKLHPRVPQSVLDFWDSDRSSSGSPWILSPCRRASSARSAVLRMELWPRSTTAKVIPIRYYSKPALLSSDTDQPIFPLRGDVLLEGALSELALWPGTVESPNPYFSMDLHSMHQRNFDREEHICELEDQEIMQTWLTTDDYSQVPWAPIDAAYWQSHAVF